MYTSATGHNRLSCALLPPDRSCTKVQVPHLALHVPLVLMPLVPLLPSSSRILDNDPCRGPSLYILFTTLLRTPLATVPYLASNSASARIYFVVACGSVGLPILDPVSVFHATSSPFPTLRLGLKYFVVTAPSSGVVSKMPQAMHGATHPLASY